MKNPNKAFIEAQKNKNDEFYTFYNDIENECKHYTKSFKDKIIYCNCDDPTKSNFFAYFLINFKKFKLKKLIATHYVPITMNDLWTNETTAVDDVAYKIEVTDFEDNITTSEEAFEYAKKYRKELKGDGNCLSDRECLSFLKESNIVVTNPPFSLMKDFISLMFEYKKDFLVIGNTNIVSYSSVFPYFKNRQLFFGVSSFNKGMYFKVPEDYEYSENYSAKKEIDGIKVMRVAAIGWFTTLPCSKRIVKQINLTAVYNEQDYPKFDNYDAIEVGIVKKIPKDYYDVMGVPTTFLYHWDPDQFEVLNCIHQPLVKNKTKFPRIIVKRK